MGTRSRIGVQNADGSITSIYCHWNGCPSGVGAMLLAHYSDPEKARALVALGDISSLRKNVAPPEGVAHSYVEPLHDVTVAYGRDRGETDVEAKKDNGEDYFLDRTKECWGEYAYLLSTSGRWLCWDDSREPIDLYAAT